MRKIPELLIFVCSCYGSLWAQVTTIVLYSIPTPNAGPASITAGPDGNLWFTEQYPGKVGKITPNGVITEYTLPTVGAYPVSITAGPDGNLWVTEGAGNSNNIARVTTSGVATEYPVPTSLADPNGITAGPDGNLWFTELGAPNIGRITPTGVITEFPISTPSYYCITVGPDGNLWNLEYGQLVKINTSGQSQVVPLPFNFNWVTSGPDGDLWFTTNSSVGRFLTNSGRPLASYQVRGVPGMITRGPDGNLWFNERGSNNIGKISTAGISTEYPVTDYSTDGGITAGPDGNIWFTIVNTNQVGKILLSNAAAASPLTLDQTSLSFTTTVGGSAPATQTISVTASLSTSFSATARFDAGYGTWLTVTPASMSTNSAVTVAVNPSGLAIGTYRGYVSLTAGNTIELVPVTLTVSSSSTVPTILGLVNAASFNSGQAAPGEIVTITGTSLGPLMPQSLTLDPSGKVATSLGGVTVSFNGFLAPLIYVSPTQINCVVPYEVVSNSPVHVQVSFNGMTSSSMTFISMALAPGIFTLDGSGIGAGAILNTSGCRNGASQCINGPLNPAPSGSMIVFYLTGEGPTTPAGVTGLVTSVNSSGTGPLTAQPLSTPIVTIGDKTAAVAFYGEAPGLVSGVLQINAIVPKGLPSGNVLLHVSFGIGIQSQDVTVTLQ